MAASFFVHAGGKALAVASEFAGGFLHRQSQALSLAVQYPALRLQTPVPAGLRGVHPAFRNRNARCCGQRADSGLAILTKQGVEL